MHGLLILLVFLLLGTSVQYLLELPLPASIVGMLLLLLFLVVRRKTPESLVEISKTLSPLLPLFIIPVSVGVITQKPLVKEYGLELVLIMALSLIPGALISAWIMKGGNSEL